MHLIPPGKRVPTHAPTPLTALNRAPEPWLLSRETVVHRVVVPLELLLAAEGKRSAVGVGTFVFLVGVEKADESGLSGLVGWAVWWCEGEGG
jgi:hypothetical protein